MRVERLLGWANGSGEQQEAKNGPPFQKPSPKRQATPSSARGVKGGPPASPLKIIHGVSGDTCFEVGSPHSNYTRKSDYGVFPDAKAAGDAVAVSFLYSDLA
jgi:hypothetical protein